MKFQELEQIRPRDTGSILGSWRSLGGGNGNPLQCSCLENPMDRGVWRATVLGVAKSWTRLSDFTFTSHFHALEKEMATHSSVPAWRIPGTGEPGGLPSIGSHRVGHDWSNLAVAAAWNNVTINSNEHVWSTYSLPNIVSTVLQVLSHSSFARAIWDTLISCSFDTQEIWGPEKLTFQSLELSGKIGRNPNPSRRLQSPCS